MRGVWLRVRGESKCDVSTVQLSWGHFCKSSLPSSGGPRGWGWACLPAADVDADCRGAGGWFVTCRGRFLDCRNAPPELKVSTPAHTQQPGWNVDLGCRGGHLFSSRLLGLFERGLLASAALVQQDGVRVCSLHWFKDGWRRGTVELGGAGRLRLQAGESTRSLQGQCISTRRGEAGEHMRHRGRQRGEPAGQGEICRRRREEEKATRRRGRLGPADQERGNLRADRPCPPQLCLPPMRTPPTLNTGRRGSTSSRGSSRASRGCSRGRGSRRSTGCRARGEAAVIVEAEAETDGDSANPLLPRPFQSRLPMLWDAGVQQQYGSTGIGKPCPPPPSARPAQTCHRRPPLAAAAAAHQPPWLQPSWPAALFSSSRRLWTRPRWPSRGAVAVAVQSDASWGTGSWGTGSWSTSSSRSTHESRIRFNPDKEGSCVHSCT